MNTKGELNTLNDILKCVKALKGEFSKEERRRITDVAIDSLSKVDLTVASADVEVFREISSFIDYSFYILGEYDKIKHISDEFLLEFQKENFEITIRDTFKCVLYLCMLYKTGESDELYSSITKVGIGGIQKGLEYNAYEEENVYPFEDLITMLYEYVEKKDNKQVRMEFVALLLDFGLRDAFSGEFASEEQMQFILEFLEKVIAAEVDSVYKDIYVIHEAFVIQEKNRLYTMTEENQVWIPLLHSFFENLNKKTFDKYKKEIESLFQRIVYLPGFTEGICLLLTNAFLPQYKEKFLQQIINTGIGFGKRIEIIVELFKNKKYKKVASFYQSCKEVEIESLRFEFAFSLDSIGNWKEARMLYEGFEKKPGPVLNNLAVIYRDRMGEWEKALTMFEEALETHLESDLFKRNVAKTKEMIEERRKEEEERPKRMKEAYFKKTKPWHKKILFVLYSWEEDELFDLERLATITKATPHTTQKNLNFIENLGMVAIENGEITFDPTIYELVQNWVSPELQSQIVKTSGSICFQPIFFHESEKRLYRTLIELFPQHLIFPNMSLQTIFSYDKLKELLDEDTFTYYLRTHVDFVVVNTTNYLPIIAFEKDSDFNDVPSQKEKVKQKDLIFECGGVPLVRLRFNGALGLEELKQNVMEKTKQLLLHYHDEDSLYKRALFEQIDVTNFGLHSQDLSLDEVEEYWNELVGEQLAKNSKIEGIDKGIIHIEIDKGFQQIIDMMYTTLCSKLINKYSSIRDIKIIWSS
ncbi:DciA family protein [Bacillus cereus]|uniref:DciA family protein n=1 Tax=Bacillus cereus TaxID=1396 RepID=UPI00201608BC|nr:DciA family protein [Bacillus cereus]